MIEFIRNDAHVKHNRIHFRAEFIINRGKMKEFKKLIRNMSKMVEVSEPNTISYSLYFDSAETKCIVHEIYADSEAVLAHNKGRASQTILPKIFSISKISKFEVYGNPSKKLQKVLTGFRPETYNLFTGFIR